MITRVSGAVSFFLILAAAGSAHAAISPAAGDSGDDASLASPAAAPSSAEPAPAKAQAATPAKPNAERPLPGNPLWAIPLRQLSNTRERPIFTPSRRPPQPAVVAPPVAAAPPPPPKPAEPERPQLSLIGTITGDVNSIGIFLDKMSKKTLRLKMGEGHEGWVLRTIQGREATLQKGRSTAVIELPAPGEKGEGSLQLIAETQAGASPFAAPQPSPQPANPFAMPQPGAPSTNPFAMSQPGAASPNPENAGPQNPFAAGIAKSLGGSAGRGGLGTR